MTNTAIWKSLSVTDPKYTKKVNVGGGFTSINAQWQIQRMTEQFGPVGLGWGYNVKHSIERITDDYVLAVADVTIWWGEPVTSNQAGQDHVRARMYGPIRGMAPIVEKSKNGYLMKDDDAGKKAATDALTKGLSHLGLSADVFLGLYDDNKYVREAGKHFAEQPHDNDGPGSSWGPGGKQSAVDEAERDGLTKNAPKVTAAKRAAFETWTKNAIGTLRLSGQTADSLTALWTSDDWVKKLDTLAEYAPDLHDAVNDAYAEARDNAPKAAA